MRFALRYHAEYRYAGPVHDQHNVIRVRPAATPLQRVRGFRLTIDPAARTRSYSDYFGTDTIEFNVAGEHERLAITAEAEVTTQAPARPPQGAGTGSPRTTTPTRAVSSSCTPTTSPRTACSTTCTAPCAPRPRTRRCCASAR